MGILQSSIAVILLISGGLQGLQIASIITALPFAVILFLISISILKALEQEAKEERKMKKIRRKKLDQLLIDMDDDIE